MTMTAVRERPVLFSGPMVRAILEGRKTQTRRVATMTRDATHVRPAQGLEGPVGAFVAYWQEPGGDEVGGTWFRCPYGRPGDRLWVREATLGAKSGDPQDLCYRVACPCGRSDREHEETRGWSPSIHMPRWASRITLEITEVRVERLGEITEEDARAEGVTPDCPIGYIPAHKAAPHRYCFAQLWDQLNAERGFSFDSSPWVWVIDFRVLEAPHAR